jgi:glycosyltransferase involved in cell wall biosynthesis
MQPFAKIPYFLSAADVVALPQRDIPFAHAQVPAKVFDAMAMAKPIIATDVGDLPAILQGCGIIIPPGDVKALGEAIHKVVDNPDLASALGNRARQRCINQYSWGKMSEDLIPIIEGIKM